MNGAAHNPTEVEGLPISIEALHRWADGDAVRTQGGFFFVGIQR